jgi:hypothetical protein
MKGDVVVLITSMQTEIVGRVKDETTTGIILESPRMFVPAQQEGGNPGFAPGVSMTGISEPTELEFNRSCVLTVSVPHPDIEAAWVQATSGIVLS